MIRIAIISPSEIAYRRFMPALSKIDQIQYVGIAYANRDEWFGKDCDVQNDIAEQVIEQERNKTVLFKKQYGGKIFKSYTSLLESDEIDAVYLPLPPALHFEWAKKALLSNKHILVEKPATTSYEETKELIDLAKKRGLAVHENYMFTFHKQLTAIDNIVKSGKIGDVRLYRLSFGFPKRSSNDFRYNKKLGGGALFDCGGYTIKYATLLLGSTANIASAQLNYIKEFTVDVYGSATLVNDQGITVQVAFGMDNSYKCELEIWGSKGSLITGRILTAPADYIPSATINIEGELEEIVLPPDDTFKKSIQHFLDSINDTNSRVNNYDSIINQAKMINEFNNITHSNIH